MIDYRKELNPEQYQAVINTEGPLLILAGAGSGKTRTLIYRVAYLVEKGIPPEEILLLTFTNKAANEMKKRASSMLDDRCARITACTYHSFCAKMLRRYACLLGYPNHYSIIDTSDMADIISMMRTERNYHKIKGFPKPNLIASVISKAVNTNRTIAGIIAHEYPKYRGYVSKIEELWTAAAEYKKKNGMMDYDDILLNFYYVLKGYPSIADKISQRYSYIMVDEYQDSNYFQEQIIFLLRQKNKNLAVVGDDSQSLYGFRGSQVENIIQFPKRMPGCNTIFLTRNYRSNQEIMDLSNYVMQAHATEGIAKNMIATHHKRAKPQVVFLNNNSQEATYILTAIMDLHKKGIPYHQICVLERGSAQSYQLEGLLNTNHIPFEKYGGIKFLEKSHVKDIICYLRIMVNERDEIAWYRVLQLIDGIGKTYARNLASDLKNSGSEGLLRNRYSKRSFQKDLEVLYKNRHQWIENNDIPDLLKKIIDYYYHLRKETIKNMRTDEETREEMYAKNESDHKELMILLKMCEGCDELITFLDTLSLEPDRKQEQAEDKLVISTIHSAKGLEFHTVFLMDCVDTVFPSTTIDEAGSKEDNEELRCFYVAITRAKENLFLLVPKAFFCYGRTFFTQKSHFLEGAEKYLA